MKKIFIVILIIIILFVTALVFDWGRREIAVSNLNQVNIKTEDSPIVVTYPKRDQMIKSPIEISGRAKGSWFFEGSFPIQLVDTNNNVIASGVATSSGEWMTENYVDFSSKIEFVKPTSTINAILVFKKDNPSGESRFDQSIFIPVVLK